jgi:hypothetical protein
MKKRTKINVHSLLLAVLCLSLLGGCVVVEHEGGHSNREKVFICHKGKKTLNVASRAVDAHLQHGDYLGPCR